MLNIDENQNHWEEGEISRKWKLKDVGISEAKIQTFVNAWNFEV